MELNTGDLLLCRGTSWLSRILEYVGQSKYSHVGIILKNPKFLCDTLEDGLYVWDASYSTIPEEEHKTRLYGVQIHKLSDYIASYEPNSLFVRRVSCDRDKHFYQDLTNIHRDVHAKPYNLHVFDWIMAKLNLSTPFPISLLWKQTSRFWCSALISYIYFRLGWISDVNWSLVAPREFSKESTGQILFTCILSDEEPLIL
jgi:hypothetical protein